MKPASFCAGKSGKFAIRFCCVGITHASPQSSLASARLIALCAAIAHSVRSRPWRSGRSSHINRARAKSLIWRVFTAMLPSLRVPCRQARHAEGQGLHRQIVGESNAMTMAATAGEVRTGGMTAEERKVIFASSLGTVFEWYDFYIYGTLGVFLAKYFFANVPPNVGFIFALLAFAAGFAVRPFGALIFGRLGDIIGRKYTFLVTMTLMGVGTFFIGVLPGYGTWGIMAPVLLIALRLVQGLALGGEYGGAATYVAEHAPAGKRGYFTSWIQTTATLGLFMA